MLATLPPFGRSEFYNAAAETERQTVNRWIRSNWKGDDVIDLDRILAQGDALAPEYDSGDGLHPNERGAARIAAEVARLQGLLEK